MFMTETRSSKNTINYLLIVMLIVNKIVKMSYIIYDPNQVANRTRNKQKEKYNKLFFNGCTDSQ